MDIEQYDNREKCEAKFMQRYRNLKQPEGKELSRILGFFRNKDYFKEFYIKNMGITKRLVRESVKEDTLIAQTISNIGEIEKSINALIKRLREWYAWYNPELENMIKNHEKFVELILIKNKNELMNDLKIENSMGAELSKVDIEPIMSLANEIKQLYELRKKQEGYLERSMKRLCPNMTEITGAAIGAKLIAQAGSMKKLMLFPASTIQLLGAEKALFRHMKTKAGAPKYGFLHEHPLITRNKRELHGKIARTIADKISIAVKVDYFKGRFIGDKLIKGLEDRFG